MPAGMRIGICWRSGLTTAARSGSYSELDDWRSLFDLDGATLVNLQYDECGEELRAAREEFGAVIHNFEDLDQMNDLDGAAALTQNLDVVVSVPTAVAQMAGALGVSNYKLGFTWFTLGTRRNEPFFPTSLSMMNPSKAEAIRRLPDRFHQRGEKVMGMPHSKNLNRKT